MPSLLVEKDLALHDQVNQVAQTVSVFLQFGRDLVDVPTIAGFEETPRGVG